MGVFICLFVSTMAQKTNNTVITLTVAVGCTLVHIHTWFARQAQSAINVVSVSKSLVFYITLSLLQSLSVMARTSLPQTKAALKIYFTDINPYCPLFTTKMMI